MAVSQPMNTRFLLWIQEFKRLETLEQFWPCGRYQCCMGMPRPHAIACVGIQWKTKWVLYTSQNSTMQYFVGEFDGQQFLSDNPAGPILKQDHGLDYYAAVAYHQIS